MGNGGSSRAQHTRADLPLRPCCIPFVRAANGKLVRAGNHFCTPGYRPALKMLQRLNKGLEKKQGGISQRVKKANEGPVCISPASAGN